MNAQWLCAGLLASAERVPDRPAVHVDGEFMSYAALCEQATALAATLQRRCDWTAAPLTAVLTDRSRATYIGILGALLAGQAYVPLNAHFPIARTQRMLKRAGCGALVVDARTQPLLDLLLAGLNGSVVVILADDDARAWSARWPQHVFVGIGDWTPASRWVAPLTPPTEIAYVLFTSGSTGVPKGVGVTNSNAVHFVGTMAERYRISCDDRFSQLFETTFDLSVFDMFVAWQRGACVYCPPRSALLNPDRYVRQHALTVWFSVPTTALLMKRLGSLQRGRYPSLRWSLFCGEPLPLDLAEAWAEAAPESVVENLYGPTELTVACTAYRWHPVRAREQSAAGLVPIGDPHPGMRARIVNEHFCEVAPGEIGELVMAGPQCVPGYWEDPEATAEAFVRGINGEIYYRTGDYVRKATSNGPLQFVGRVDHQVKIAGHRVELGEVEAVLRQEPGVSEAVALGWPRTPTGVSGIAAFLTGSDIDVLSVRARVRTKLQSYAVPQTIQVLPALPQNANGKVDRQALLNLLNL